LLFTAQHQTKTKHSATLFCTSEHVLCSSRISHWNDNMNNHTMIDTGSNIVPASARAHIHTRVHTHTHVYTHMHKFIFSTYKIG